MLFMKVFRKGNEKIVAVCDSEIIGKVLREGEITLDLERYADFYKGESVDENKVKNELKSATSMNLVGDRAVSIAKNLRLVKESDIIRIAHVPHVQIYKI